MFLLIFHQNSSFLKLVYYLISQSFESETTRVKGHMQEKCQIPSRQKNKNENRLFCVYHFLNTKRVSILTLNAQVTVLPR